MTKHVKPSTMADRFWRSPPDSLWYASDIAVIMNRSGAWVHNAYATGALPTATAAPHLDGRVSTKQQVVAFIDSGWQMKSKREEPAEQEEKEAA